MKKFFLTLPLALSLVVGSVLLAGAQTTTDPMTELVAARAALVSSQDRLGGLEGDISEALVRVDAAIAALNEPPPPPPPPPSAECTGVQVAAGANLVTVASDNGPGTTFCLSAGTYPITASIPFETGDQWFGALGPENARLSVITGSGTTAYLVTATSNNVLLANVIVERFANASQQGVNTGAQTQWVFDNVEVRENQSFGLHSHNGTTIRNSFIHHNHQMGLGGNGDNVLIEGNEISFNNYLGETAPGFEAGGTKWVNAVNLTIRGNFAHHNCGNGLWVDGGGVNVLIENNVAEDNWAAGIFSELNPGPITIRNNVANRNAFGDAGTACNYPGGAGQGGIRVNDSSDVEVYGNTLADNDGGISSVDGSRSPDITNLFVHDNTVTWTVGRTGMQDTASGSGEPFSPAANNRYVNNTYHYEGTDPAPFQWAGNKSWAQWQAAGQDQTGSFD